jgi:glycolate oxidase
MDGTIPRKSLGTDAQGDRADGDTNTACKCMNVFHAGDGNLHPLILFDANCEGAWERADRFGADILELCVQLGGTITGEHGVGRGEAQFDVRAVLAGRARGVLRRQARL